MVLALRHVYLLFKDLAAYSWINEVWWPIPLVLILLVVGVLAVTTQATLPYIYTIF